MSKLKLSPNLFLEVAELENFRRLIVDEGYKAVFKSMVKNFGIASDSNVNAFEVTATGEENVISIAPGTAWDKDFNRIINLEVVTAQAIQSDTRTWVVLSRAVNNYEPGTVSVATDGTLTGVGTEFTKVLRGGDNFPNAVKFIDSTKNILNYEVINVVSDTSAVIAAPAAAESGIRYGVVGAFTPGFVPSTANELIYEYDSFVVRMIQSETQPEVEEGREFIIAQLNWDSSDMAIVDMRNSCTFNAEPVEEITAAATNIVSVLDVERFGNMLRIGVENGYTVTSFEIRSSALQFRILGGHNNVLGTVSGDTGTIPSSTFAGWTLFNRATGKGVRIVDNANTTLTLASWSGDISLGEGDDFVIVPSVSEIEYQMVASGATTWGGVRSTARFPVTDAAVNIFVPLNAGQTSLTMRFRDVSGQSATAFKAFPQATYQDRIASSQKTLINSVLTVNL